MRRTSCLLIATLFPLAACNYEQPAGASPQGTTSEQGDVSRPFASRDRAAITLHPSKLNFKIPAVWVNWYNEHKNNLYLARAELEPIRQPERDEWDVEFARICNAALPFDRCAAHVGSEGWGNEGRFFNDFQVRVYDLPDSIKDVEARIVKQAPAEACSHDMRVGTHGSWRRILVSYERFHFDYGTTAHIDFRLRSFGARTLAFAFMYTDAHTTFEDVAEIMDSVRDR